MQPLAQRGYTADEVLAALRGRYGTRRITARYDLLDNDNGYLRALDNVRSSWVSQNTLADIKRVARFTLRGDGGINFLSDRIQPWVRLDMPGLSPTEPATYDDVLAATLTNVGADAAPKLRYKLDEPIPSYRAAMTGLDPLLWYRMDEPAGALTAFNSGSAGELHNGTNAATGMSGQTPLVPSNPAPGAHAYQFTAASSHAVTALSDALSGKTAISIAAWVDAVALGTNGTIVASSTADVGGTIHVDFRYSSASSLGPATTNIIRGAVRSGATISAAETVGSSQSTGLQHLVMTWESGQQVRIFVNGVEATYNGTGNPTMAGASAATSRVITGSRGSAGFYWDGKIDEVATWERRLSAAEILDLYRSGAGMAVADNAGSLGASYDGLPTGTGMPGAYGLVLGGSSYRIDPVNNNQVRLPAAGTAFDNADRLLVSYWFRVNDLNANDFFVDGTNNGAQDDGLSIWKHTSNLIVIRLKLTTGYFWLTTPAQSLSKDTTYHLAFTWQTGLPARCWLNGVEQVLAVQSGSQPIDSVGLIDMPNADLYLGRWMFDSVVGSGNLLNGMLDDVVITDAYVDSSDVAKLYQAGVQSGKYAGENYVEWPQGVFLLTSPQRESDPYNTITRNVDAYDQLQVFSDDLVTERFTATMGDPYTEVISGLLGNIAKNVSPSALELPVSREWEPGTSKLAIINDLCQGINYESLFFDEHGEAIVRPYVAPADRAPEFVYRDDADSVTVPQVSQVADLFGVPNKWVLTVSEPDRPALRAEVINDDPNSLTSTLARGRTITDFRVEQEAADLTTLQAKAERLALEASQVYEVVTFDTLIMPFHSHSDVYTFAYGNLTVDDKYAEQAWEMYLEAGTTMRHTIRKVVNLNVD